MDPAWEAEWEAQWETANKHFHETLIGAFDSPWSKVLLGVLYRHAERYRHVALKMGAAEDVHREHTEICTAALARQEARAALALEAHVRLTSDILTQRAKSGPA